MAILSDNTDVPPREASSVLAVTEDGLNHEYRRYFEVNVDSASGRMMLVYDATLEQMLVEALLPVYTSTSATEPGRMLVAQGAYFADRKVKVALSGTGVPTISDGWDGAYWLDTTTGYVYGPRGEAVAGEWPASPRREVKIVTGSDAVKRQTLERNLDLGGVDSGNDGIWAGTQPGGEPIKMLHVVNVAHFGTASVSDGYVGLELQIGTSTLAKMAMKPYGPGANLDMFIGGKGTGTVRNLLGSPYITESAQAAMPHWIGVCSNAVVYTTANDDVVIPVTGVTPRSLGTWTTGANGVAVPETGLYEVRAFLNGRCEVGAPGAVKFSLRVNGAAIVNGPQEVYSYATAVNQFHQGYLDGGVLSLTAGDFVGVHILVLAQSVNLGFNYGSFSIRRIA